MGAVVFVLVFEDTTGIVSRCSSLCSSSSSSSSSDGFHAKPVRAEV